MEMRKGHLFGSLPTTRVAAEEARDVTDERDALAAEVRKYEAGFDGIVAYIARANDDDSVGIPEMYSEIIDRLYHTFDADPKTGQRR
jgi:hypothetical protein